VLAEECDALNEAFNHWIVHHTPFVTVKAAMTLDGKILWQLGRPDPRNGLLTNDTPFQIYDLDGDGRNEVVMVRDFQIQVLEGSTGKVLQRAWMPAAARDNKD